MILVPAAQGAAAVFEELGSTADRLLTGAEARHGQRHARPCQEGTRPRAGACHDGCRTRRRAVTAIRCRGGDGRVNVLTAG